MTIFEKLSSLFDATLEHLALQLARLADWLGSSDFWANVAVNLIGAAAVAAFIWWRDRRAKKLMRHSTARGLLIAAQKLNTGLSLYLEWHFIIALVLFRPDLGVTRPVMAEYAWTSSKPGLSEIRQAAIHVAEARTALQFLVLECDPETRNVARKAVYHLEKLLHVLEVMMVCYERRQYHFFSAAEIPDLKAVLGLLHHGEKKLAWDLDAYASLLRSGVNARIPTVQPHMLYVFHDSHQQVNTLNLWTSVLERRGVAPHSTPIEAPRVAGSTAQAKRRRAAEFSPLTFAAAESKLLTNIHQPNPLEKVLAAEPAALDLNVISGMISEIERDLPQEKTDLMALGRPVVVSPEGALVLTEILHHAPSQFLSPESATSQRRIRTSTLLHRFVFLANHKAGLELARSSGDENAAMLWETTYNAQMQSWHMAELTEDISRRLSDLLERNKSRVRRPAV